MSLSVLPYEADRAAESSEKDCSCKAAGGDLCHSVPRLSVRISVAVFPFNLFSHPIFYLWLLPDVKKTQKILSKSVIMSGNGF